MEPGEQVVIYPIQFFPSFSNFESILRFEPGNKIQSKIQLFFFDISIQFRSESSKKSPQNRTQCLNLDKITTRARITTSRTVSERRSVVLSKHVGPAEPKIQLPLVRDTNILKIQLLITALSGQSTKFHYFRYFFS